MQPPDSVPNDIPQLPIPPPWYTKPEAAVFYAQNGFAVFPVHGVVDGECTCRSAGCPAIGKHPATEHGFKNATTDLNIVRAWWAKNRDWNIGSPTAGAPVVDVDPRHNGNAVTDRWAEQHGAGFLQTTTVWTGGTGRHLRYGYPADSHSRLGSRNGVFPGIDIKAEGGYVILPPSTHASGVTYSWAPGKSPCEIETAEIPGWMLTELAEASTSSERAAKRTMSEILEGVPEGERNSEIHRLASSLRGAGVPKWGAEDVALKAAGNCSPPLPGDEALQIVRSAYARYGPNSSGITLDDSYIPTSDLLAGVEAEIGWVLEPVIPCGQVTVLFGHPESGKTTFAVWVVKHAVEAGKGVLYFDADSGRSSMGRRLRAMGLADEAHGRFRYYQYPSAQRRSAGDYRRLFAQFLPSLVVFDALADFLQGAGLDEDKGGDVTAWFDDFVRPARELGIAVLILDHVRKSRDGSDSPRGSGAKIAKVDVAWSQSDGPLLAGTSVTLTRRKDREGICPPQLGYLFSETGERIAFEPEVLPQRSKTRSRREIVLDALRDAGIAGLPNDELAQAAAVSRSTISGDLSAMCREGRIVKYPETRGARYYLPGSSPLRAELQPAPRVSSELLSSDSSAPLKGGGKEEDPEEEDRNPNGGAVR